MQGRTSGRRYAVRTPVDGAGDSGVTYSCVAGACQAVCKSDTECDTTTSAREPDLQPSTKTCQKGRR
jgi:hypothetical protein